MATRAERVDEAFELIQGREGLLELLALNEIPLRRAYFTAVTGLASEKVVRSLAKLANAGMLEETDGLLFRIVSPEEGEEVVKRIAPERRRQLHEDSLAWALAEEFGDPRFKLSHLIGAGRLADAAELATELLADETDAFRARSWTTRLRTILDAMLDGDGHDPELLRRAGVTLIERAGKDMKSRELARLNSRLKEKTVSEEDHLFFDTLVEQAKKARADEAAARIEAERAEAEQLAEDAADGSGAN